LIAPRVFSASAIESCSSLLKCVATRNNFRFFVAENQTAPVPMRLAVDFFGHSC
jgi:hypothetical protein